MNTKDILIPKIDVFFEKQTEENNGSIPRFLILVKNLVFKKEDNYGKEYEAIDVYKTVHEKNIILSYRKDKISFKLNYSQKDKINIIEKNDNNIFCLFARYDKKLSLLIVLGILPISINEYDDQINKFKKETINSVDAGNLDECIKDHSLKDANVKTLFSQIMTSFQINDINPNDIPIRSIEMALKDIREKKIKNKLIDLLKDCAEYREVDVKDNANKRKEKIKKSKEMLIIKIKKESVDLISNKAHKKTFSISTSEDKQIELLINVLLEENIWLLGYGPTSKVNIENKTIVTKDNIIWKPDLIIDNKFGGMDIFELKQADVPVLIWDHGHKCFSISSAVVKGVSQLENQMVALMEKNASLTKNDTLYLIIGSRIIENKNNPKAMEYFQKLSLDPREEKLKQLQLLRNSFKNVKIILYDEL